MKHSIRIGLLVLLALGLQSNSASSQLASPKRILVVRSIVNLGPFRLDTTLPSIFSGTIDYAMSLPANFATYDAVLIDLSSMADTLSGRTDLWDYVRHGGNLYLEGYDYAASVAGGVSRPFWDSVGVDRSIITSVNIFVDTLSGVDGYFTSDLHYGSPFQQVNEVSMGGPSGRIHTILNCGQSNNLVLPVAWTGADSTLHLVLHRPITIAGLNYYEPFLQKTLCQFFGLCSLGVPGSQGDESQIAVTIEQMNGGEIITARCDRRATLEILDILGRVRYSNSLAPGSERVEVPSDLEAGTYIVALSTPSARRSTRMVVVR